MPRKMTREEVLIKFKEAHGDRYDYSLFTEYKNNRTKIKIICKEHGEFEQLSDSHLRGFGCRECAHISAANKRKNNIEDIKKRAKKVHRNKYDYSLFTEYKNNKVKVKIICPKHGEFLQSIDRHLSGDGCSKCGIAKRSLSTKRTLADVKKQLKNLYGDIYGYDLFTEYNHCLQKIKITCKKHGVFEKALPEHLRGEICNGCSKEKRIEKGTHRFFLRDNAKRLELCNHKFVKRAKEIHGDKYDYSNTKYIGSAEKLEIYCNTCKDVFTIPANSHTQGRGCMICSMKARSANNWISLETFIEKCKEVHGDYYSYDKVISYEGGKSIVKVFCTHCKEYFEIKAAYHLHSKNGCTICSGERQAKDRRITKEEVVVKAREIHGDLYEYKFLGEIKSNKDFFIVICAKHGEVSQRIADHIHKGCGCNQCNKSKGEIKIEKWLKANNIEFLVEETFEDCKNVNVLPFDFYLPENNTLIEYQGEQHTNLIPYFHKTEEHFEDQQKRDKIKKEYAVDNGYTFIEIHYHEFDNIEKILEGHITKKATP